MFNVVFASSDMYSSLLLVSLTSLLENNSNEFDCINVYILDDGIKENNKNKIYNLSQKYNCEIYFIKTINLESLEVKLTKHKTLSGDSLTTYSRLFLPSLLPNDVDKVLYLDCDGLILDSYRNLWDIDISDYFCAGILDAMSDTFLRCLGYEEDVSYVNAGVLLINLKKWREENVEEKFIEFLSKNQGEFFFHDQGVINNVFINKIKIIEPKYNLQYYFQFYDYKLSKKLKGISREYYTKEILDENRKKPVFVHFCGPDEFKPWINKDHKYSDEFERYAKLADIYDKVINYKDLPTFKLKILYKGIDNKFIRFLLNMIPNNIFENIVNNFDKSYFESEVARTKDSLKN